MDLVQKWRHVLNNVHMAAVKAQRDTSSIQLLAVSKTFALSDIQTLFAAGQIAFGESYAQELKIKALAMPQLQWHFIGPVQSNKTRIVATHASWVHSVDREKTLDRLSVQRPADLPALNICLEVNVSEETTKSGVLPNDVNSLAKIAMQYDNVRLRGLMCLPEATQDIGRLKRQFIKLRQLFDELNQQGLAVDTLSMGMTQDFAIAIAEGATIVRLGSAIFGNRKNASSIMQS